MNVADTAGMFLLDFPRFMAQIERARSQEVKQYVGNYPPVNILRNEVDWIIQVALAGYNSDDIEVTVADGNLIVKSAKRTECDDGLQWVYRGISQRAFERRWQLEADMEVTSAAFENGMLVINVTRVVVEEKKPKVVPIKKSGNPN